MAEQGVEPAAKQRRMGASESSDLVTLEDLIKREGKRCLFEGRVCPDLPSYAARGNEMSIQRPRLP